MKTENVVGIDVGKNGNAVACCLTHFPDSMKRWFLENSGTTAFFCIAPDKDSMERIKQLKPAAIVMEPTGSHYSAFWGRFAKVNRIPVYWMSHQELYGQRSHFGFRNKTDAEDALCLAASYFDPKFVDRWGEKRFLKHYHLEKVSQLRELVYEAEQLKGLRTALVNQLRQRLSLEFPEMAGKEWQRGRKGYTPFLGWLGYDHPNKRFARLWDESVVHALGVELTEYSQEHAKAIVDIEERLTRHENHISALMDDPEFAPYQEVFTELGFGLAMRSLFLRQIYPFEKFLSGGEPLIEFQETAPGKFAKRHRSLRSFQSYLGLSRRIDQSGMKEVKTFSGSALCRSHLYAWFLCKIAINRPELQLKTATGVKLRAKWDKTKVANIKGKDAIIRCLYLATRIMFQEFVSKV